MIIEAVILLMGMASLIWVSTLGGAAMLLGAAIYLLSKGAMIFFLNRSAPGLLEADIRMGPLEGGGSRWERTAGQGVVPKWLSYVSLASMLIVFGGLLVSLYALLALFA